MSIPLISRLISFSIRPKTPAFSFTSFAPTSPLENCWTHLQKNDPNIEKTLTRIVGSNLNASCVKELIKRCSLGSKYYVSGLRFFVWAGIQGGGGGYKHSSYMYNIACKHFKIHKNPNLIKEVVEAYRVDKCVVSVKSFKIVLSLCKEAKIGDEGLWVFRKMSDFGCRPDTTAYNVVIRLLCETGRVDEGLKLMEEMKVVGCYPDMVTFVTLVKGFCDLGKVEDAYRLFEVMDGQGCLANVVAYSALLDGYCRVGNLEKGLDLLKEMENKGGACAPTVVTYTTMIHGFCEKGRTNEALTILDRMELCGCAPNRVTISTLIDGLCKEEQVEEAYKLVDRFFAKESVSKSECYSSLVVTLMRVGKFGEAEKVFRRMLVSGLKPDGASCSELLKRLCLKEQRVLDAFTLLTEIEKLGFVTSIDSEICSIMMKGLWTKKHSLEASKLAMLMAQNKILLKPSYV
uniref:pentatricopeptide repeat-containing protein At5g47360-like n=1 Tax=Erigeron canadensis TaxID=72917 RepID=UPI001CB89D75|nr:pentatricopeptide repeat-containing protein At5g47360-like [Erigeron canadensis]